MRIAITELFEQLVRELPPDVATVTVDPLPDHRGAVIRLKPSSPEAAAIWVFCDDFEVLDVGFGAESRWEFPYERRYRKDEKNVLSEIEEMSRAVIEGRCKEKRGWFSLTGSLRVEGYTYRMTNLPKVSIPPFWAHRYAPYASDSPAGPV